MTTRACHGSSSSSSSSSSSNSSTSCHCCDSSHSTIDSARTSSSRYGHGNPSRVICVTDLLHDEPIEAISVASKLVRVLVNHVLQPLSPNISQLNRCHEPMHTHQISRLEVPISIEVVVMKDHPGAQLRLVDKIVHGFGLP